MKSLPSLFPRPCNSGCSVCISVCLATAQIVSVLGEAMPSWRSHHTHLVFVDSYRIISHRLASLLSCFHREEPLPPPRPCLPRSLISFQHLLSSSGPELFTNNLPSQVKDQSYQGRMGDAVQTGGLGGGGELTLSKARTRVQETSLLATSFEQNV